MRTGVLDTLAFPTENSRGYAKYDTNATPWARPGKGGKAGADFGGGYADAGPMMHGGDGGGMGGKKGKRDGGKKGARGKKGGKPSGGDRWHEGTDQLMMMLENPWHEFGIGAKYVVDFGALKPRAGAGDGAVAAAPTAAPVAAGDAPASDDDAAMDDEDLAEYGVSAGALLGTAAPAPPPMPPGPPPPHAGVPLARPSAAEPGSPAGAPRTSIALSLPPPRAGRDAEAPAPSTTPLGEGKTKGLSLASLLPPPEDKPMKLKTGGKKKAKKRKRVELAGTPQDAPVAAPTAPAAPVADASDDDGDLEL